MTNYEWIVKNEGELVKGILARHIGKEKGKTNSCNKIYCTNCDFRQSLNDNSDCEITTRKWLETEHEPLYKIGDILIIKNRDIVIVTKEDSENSVIASHNIGCAERGEGWRVPFDEIERKIGNIYDMGRNN